MALYRSPLAELAQTGVQSGTSIGAMGSLDPYAEIRAKYRQFLGREPSPEELQQAVSGSPAPSPTTPSSGARMQGGTEAPWATPTTRQRPLSALGQAESALIEEGTGGGETVTTPGARVNPWDDPASSKNAPRVVVDNTGTYLTEHGNRRRLANDKEIADAQAYVADFWAKYPTGFMPGVGPQKNEDYRAAGSGGATPGVGGAGASNYAYSGFNFGQDAGNRDVAKSAKYAFAQATAEAAASGADDSWKTRAGAETFAEKWLKPYLEQQGYSVLEIVGDKIRIITREAAAAGNTNGVWIDWVVNADGDNPSLAWQEQSPSWKQTAARYTTPAATAPGTTPADPATAGTTGSSPAVMSAYARRKLVDPLASLALY